MSHPPSPFWSIPASELLRQLDTTEHGLSEEEAEKRLLTHGPNALRPKKKTDTLTIFLFQFKSPIILILLCAAVLSFFLGDSTDALIISGIVLISGLLSFWQERGAIDATEKLLAIVQIKASVIRDGGEREIPLEEVVPGDVVVLNAGDMIPGDCIILESKDLFVDEATLTGETYPQEKMAGPLPSETLLNHRLNALFLGTHVVSGDGYAVVVNTGITTEFGLVSERLRIRPPENEFEHGVRRFGYLLMEITLLMVIAIFAFNVFLRRTVLDSFLFALALAVGLIPQLLPAIISVNLAHGAQRMAQKKVIVKRLASIENFGSMNVLCSDKTGTLTEGLVHVNSFLGTEGEVKEKVLFYAYLNSCYETGFTNPIDEAIRTHRVFDISGYTKLDEVPYDFIRKRLSILFSDGREHIMVTKGALPEILAICSSSETSKRGVVGIGEMQKTIERHFEEQSDKGLRILGVAYKDMGKDTLISKDMEASMTFLGFLVLFDPPKQGIDKTVRSLKELGVLLKIITGDNRLVAATVGTQVGITTPRMLTGLDLRCMSDEALTRVANDVDIFAEVEPNQKERIIMALRRAGNVVGYMGDGINDASALHSSDVGISVDSAVDVAKEAADIVLLEKDLNVLIEGIHEGRKTFSNTIKYVFMASSANFGNMVSMACASLFLPFLPLLPKQILFTNLLTDFPEMTIASDSVDNESMEKPRRWNISYIRTFMLIFGPLSSLFDFLTFGVLLFILKAGPSEFRTGWFIESVVSASLIVLVMRTRRPFFKSRPSPYLLIATILVVAAALLFPATPLGRIFGFTSIPFLFFAMLGGIVILYVISAEAAKGFFYRRVRY
jgi:Mg2+-importing ATPase